MQYGTLQLLKYQMCGGRLNKLTLLYLPAPAETFIDTAVTALV